jgi:hypothetical protein
VVAALNERRPGDEVGLGFCFSGFVWFRGVSAVAALDEQRPGDKVG